MPVLHQLSRDLGPSDHWPLMCALEAGDVLLLIDAAVNARVLEHSENWMRAGVRVMIPALEIPAALPTPAGVERIDDLRWIALVAEHESLVEWL